MNIDPLQTQDGRLQFSVDSLTIRLFDADGLAFDIRGRSVFVPIEIFELFLAQRNRAVSKQSDPCLHCESGETIFFDEEDGTAVHHIWHDETGYQPEPCLNLQK